MASLCTIQIIGNLGRDPETRFTPAGRQVTSFTVAVNRIGAVGADGERAKETEWFRVSCWGKQAETAEQYLQKGRPVYISGRFSSRQFTGNDGQQRTSLEIQADQLVLLGSGQQPETTESAGTPAQAGAASARTSQSPARRPTQPNYEDDIAEDDIPF